MEKLASGRVTPKRITEAIPKTMKELVVIGLDRNGEFYSASSTGDVDQVLSLLEQLRRRLLDGTY